MGTLEEIEQAVPALTLPEIAHLEALLRDLRRQQASPQPKHTNLADFSGALHLTEEPLAWQKNIRQEWE